MFLGIFLFSVSGTSSKTVKTDNKIIIRPDYEYTYVENYLKLQGPSSLNEAITDVSKAFPNGQILTASGTTTAYSADAAAGVQAEIRDKFEAPGSGLYRVAWNYHFLEEEEFMKSRVRLEKFAPLIWGESRAHGVLSASSGVLDMDGEMLAQKNTGIYNQAKPENFIMDMGKKVFAYITTHAVGMGLPYGYGKTAIEASQVLSDSKEFSIAPRQMSITLPLEKGEVYRPSFNLLNFSESTSAGMGTSGVWIVAGIKLDNIVIKKVESKPPTVSFTQTPDPYPEGRNVTISWKGETETSTNLLYSYKHISPSGL